MRHGDVLCVVVIAAKEKCLRLKLQVQKLVVRPQHVKRVEHSEPVKDVVLGFGVNRQGNGSSAANKEIRRSGTGHSVAVGVNNSWPALSLQVPSRATSVASSVTELSLSGPSSCTIVKIDGFGSSTKIGANFVWLTARVKLSTECRRHSPALGQAESQHLGHLCRTPHPPRLGR